MNEQLPPIGQRVRVTIPPFIPQKGIRIFEGRVIAHGIDALAGTFTISTHEGWFSPQFVTVENLPPRRAGYPEHIAKLVDVPEPRRATSHANRSGS